MFCIFSPLNVLKPLLNGYDWRWINHSWLNTWYNAAIIWISNIPLLDIINRKVLIIYSLGNWYISGLLWLINVRDVSYRSCPWQLLVKTELLSGLIFVSGNDSTRTLVKETLRAGQGFVGAGNNDNYWSRKIAVKERVYFNSIVIFIFHLCCPCNLHYFLHRCWSGQVLARSR